MIGTENKTGESRSEEYIIWVINLVMLLLAVETWRILDEKWNSLNHWPVYICRNSVFLSTGRKNRI
jgi:hypothetical protein